jgi:hypothetical protein
VDVEARSRGRIEEWAQESAHAALCQAIIAQSPPWLSSV